MSDTLPEWYDGSRWATNDYIVAQGFPTVTQFRRGILLGCIVEAVSLVEQGSFPEHAWQDNVYNQDIHQGEAWAVAFTDAGAVAVFYSSESERNPHPEGSETYDQSRYFRGMPDRLLEAKERALAWMVNFDFVVGGPNAVITAAMWADGEQFTAAEPWADVFQNCLWDCDKQLLPLEVALVRWQNYFGLGNPQMALARSIYERKLASPDATMTLDPYEVEKLRAFAVAHSPRNPELQVSREAFAAIGIVLP